MSDSEVLNAEYRAFIKALHPATVDTLLAVEAFWTQKLFPSVVAVSARDASEVDRGPDPLERPEAELDAEWRREIRSKLLNLVHGHPDPDVREAADFLSSRLYGAIFYMAPERAAREGGEESRIAVRRVHDGITNLARAIYHAPFRVERPTPTYEGLPIGNSEPMPSRVAAGQS